jgi:hypothetical protein
MNDRPWGFKGISSGAIQMASSVRSCLCGHKNAKKKVAQWVDTNRKRVRARPISGGHLGQVWVFPDSFARPPRVSVLAHWPLSPLFSHLYPLFLDVMLLMRSNHANQRCTAGHRRSTAGHRRSVVGHGRGVDSALAVGGLPTKISAATDPAA